MSGLFSGVFSGLAFPGPEGHHPNKRKKPLHPRRVTDAAFRTEFGAFTAAAFQRDDRFVWIPSLSMCSSAASEGVVVQPPCKAPPAASSRRRKSILRHPAEARTVAAMTLVYALLFGLWNFDTALLASGPGQTPTRRSWKPEKPSAESSMLRSTLGMVARQTRLKTSKN